MTSGVALLQVGCLDEGPGSEHLSNGQIDSAPTGVGPDESGVKELADKITWISVMKAPLSEKTPKVLDVFNGSQGDLASVQIWRQNGNVQQSWDIAQWILWIPDDLRIHQLAFGEVPGHEE